MMSNLYHIATESCFQSQLFKSNNSLKTRWFKSLTMFESMTRVLIFNELELEQRCIARIECIKEVEILDAK